MKATKEQIIQMGCQIVKDVLRDEYIESTIKVNEEKVSIFPNKSGVYYEHDGWFFHVKSIHNYGEFNDGYLIWFMDDGNPLRLCIAHGDGISSSTGKYIVKSSTGKYISVSDVDFFKHHNFDFTKEEFTKKNF